MFVLIQWITVAHEPMWGPNLSPLDRYGAGGKKMGKQMERKMENIKPPKRASISTSYVIEARVSQDVVCTACFLSLKVNRTP